MQEYSNLTALELRELCLNGELDGKSMSMEDFEKLFGHEIALADPSATVLDFCTLGLDGFDKYCSDMPMPTLESVLQKRKVKKIPKARRFVPTSRLGRLVATIAICVAVGLIALQGVAMAMGYDNFIAWIRSALSSDERATVDTAGNQTFLDDNVRIYDSIEDLFETENLNVLFPTSLPNGYAFTDFIVLNIDSVLEIQAVASNPLIEFTVYVGASVQLDSYDHEGNDIKYRIAEMGEGLYQADFSYEDDYYTIVVSDRVVLSEIMNNLARE